MAAEPSPKRVKLSSAAGDFVCDANEVINFRLIDHHTDVLETELQGEGRVFPPLMCHQHFGEQEEIKGYTGLIIDIWLSARTYHPWIDINFSHKRATADDVMDALVENFPAGYAVDREQYLQTLQSCSVADVWNLGTTLSSTTMSDGSELRVQLHQLTTADPLIKELHSRMEALTLFFIDAASFIEKDDPNWHVLLAVRRCEGHDLVVGFATVYKFFAFPDRQRLRLSQILVLTPFQGQGVGRNLLLAAYKMAEDCNATDLTLEDPTEELLRIREKVDLQKMAELVWLRELAQKTAAEAAALPPAAGSENGGGLIHSATQKRHPLALSPADVSRAQEESKIHKASVKALWEALLFSQLQGGKGGRALEAVKELVAWRLRSMYMGSSSTANAEGKLLIETGIEGVFDLIRLNLPQPEGKEPPEQAGGEGTVQVGGGRGMNEVAAEDVEKELEELLERRMERVQALAATLS